MHFLAFYLFIFCKIKLGQPDVIFKILRRMLSASICFCTEELVL